MNKTMFHGHKLYVCLKQRLKLTETLY